MPGFHPKLTRYTKIFLSVVILAACGTKPEGDSASAASKARDGAPAPDFTLQSTDGKTVKLADLKGKVVLLDFWATWCPPCRVSTPALVRLNEKFKGKNLTVIGINLDEDTSKVVPYIQKAKIKHPVLYGNGEVESNYKIRSIPTFYLLNPNGVVVKHYEGYHPDFEKEWETEINSLLLAKK